jgi:hypothetical protein
MEDPGVNSLSRYQGGGLPRVVRNELAAQHYEGVRATHQIRTVTAVTEIGMLSAHEITSLEGQLIRSNPACDARVAGIASAGCRAIEAEVIRLAIG